ncbi:MAG: polyprenyl synthetase family protein [candidate division Zixibacteria bacterium]|nr:polyprenyl synthetase family protein [candidate division Zixibacteria bacterium]
MDKVTEVNMIDKVRSITSSIKADVDKLIFERLPSTNPVREVQLLYDMMRDYPMRPGKGLRPVQCVLYCKAFGGDGDKAILTAAALELFQNWIVIHDDIEDGSELRRGDPSLHYKHGVPLAINAGDALAGRMWDMLLSNQKFLGEIKTLKLFELFLEMLHRTTSGQHIELSWVENGAWELAEEDYAEMCRLKTAYYTCVVPAVAGAVIAGYNGNLEDKIQEVGLNLGVAFQIRDDILNLVGDVGKYGKEILGDISEGKRTLIVIHFMNNASKTDRDEFLMIMSKPREEKSDEEVNRVMDLFQKYGSIDYARGVSKDLAQKAKKSFMELDFPGPLEAVEDLKVLIDYMVDRDC